MRAGWVVVVALLIGCGKKIERPSREDCTKVADHIANLIMENFGAHPDLLWDGVHSRPGDPGMPSDVTKETFAAWLDTAAGKAWFEQRGEGAKQGTHTQIDNCMRATKKSVDCMLAATKQEQIEPCDKVR